MNFNIDNKPLEQKISTESSVEMYEAFAQVHDAMIRGEDATSLEMFDNLKEIVDLVNNNRPMLVQVIQNDPELRDMYVKAGSVEAFANIIATNMNAAEEGFLADAMWDGWLVAIIKRNDKLLEHLAPLVGVLIQQVQAADDKKFGKWKMFKQINVFAKYLPDQDDYGKCVAALSKAMNYLRGTDPNSFDQNKFNACFTGSIYAKKNGTVSGKTTHGTQLLGLAQVDIRMRGWTEKKHFLDGLNQMKKLIDDMLKLKKHLADLKSKQFEKDPAKTFTTAANLALDLGSYLGRGITSAASKISGSIWRRLFAIEQ